MLGLCPLTGCNSSSGGIKVSLSQEIPAAVAFISCSPRHQHPSTCEGGEGRKQSGSGKDGYRGYSFIQSFIQQTWTLSWCWDSQMNVSALQKLPVWGKMARYTDPYRAQVVQEGGSTRCRLTRLGQDGCKGLPGETAFILSSPPPTNIFNSPLYRQVQFRFWGIQPGTTWHQGFPDAPSSWKRQTRKYCS